MLEKIFKFFKKIFKSKKQQYLEAPKAETIPVANIEKQKGINFKNQIIVDNEAENRILKLQKDYKAGLIQEEDLSEEDFDALTKLYETQIEKTKKSIENYKNKILRLKAQKSKIIVDIE